MAHFTATRPTQRSYPCHITAWGTVQVSSWFTGSFTTHAHNLAWPKVRLMSSFKRQLRAEQHAELLLLLPARLSPHHSPAGRISAEQRHAQPTRNPHAPPRPFPTLTSDQVPHQVLVRERCLLVLLLLVVGARRGLRLLWAAAPLRLGAVGLRCSSGSAGCGDTDSAVSAPQTHRHPPFLLLPALSHAPASTASAASSAAARIGATETRRGRGRSRYPAVRSAP